MILTFGSVLDYSYTSHMCGVLLFNFVNNIQYAGDFFEGAIFQGASLSSYIFKNINKIRRS